MLFSPCKQSLARRQAFLSPPLGLASITHRSTLFKSAALHGVDLQSTCGTCMLSEKNTACAGRHPPPAKERKVYAVLDVLENLRFVHPAGFCCWWPPRESKATRTVMGEQQRRVQRVIA